MKFFDYSSTVPTLQDFQVVAKEIEEIIKMDSSFLTCALWWGSYATKTLKVTSDLDLVFLYPLENTTKVRSLIGKINLISSRRNVPVEIMCLPEEFYFGTGKFDISKLFMIMEVEDLDDSFYICGSRGNFTLEKFGFAKGGPSINRLQTESYKDYVCHKYEKWMRLVSERDKLSETEQCKLVGKFISTPAHAVRKFGQAKGYQAIGFEKCVVFFQMEDDVLKAYLSAEEFKRKYSSRFLFNNDICGVYKSKSDFLEIRNQAMEIAGSFIMTAAKNCKY